MDVLEAIYTRRSIRKYTGESVSEEDVKTLLRAGSYAPSAHNRQSWEFLIVRDKDKFEKIAEFHSYAKMLPKADVLVVVCGDSSRQGETGFLIEDCSAAIENMLLAAHGIGLGAVWCGLYPVTHLTKNIRGLFGLPKTIIPVGMIVIGHKGEERTVSDRFDEEKLHYEKW